MSIFRVYLALSTQTGTTMSSYIQESLVDGENIIHSGKISIWSLAPLILLGFILLPAWGVGILCWIAAGIRYLTTELAFTNKRVIAKFGFISRDTVEININKIESIQVNQGILGRIFDYGTLVISGAGTPQAPIPGIANPMQFRRAFMGTQSA